MPAMHRPAARPPERQSERPQTLRGVAVFGHAMAATKSTAHCEVCCCCRNRCPLQLLTMPCLCSTEAPLQQAAAAWCSQQPCQLQFKSRGDTVARSQGSLAARMLCSHREFRGRGREIERVREREREIEREIERERERRTHTHTHTHTHRQRHTDSLGMPHPFLALHPRTDVELRPCAAT